MKKKRRETAYKLVELTRGLVTAVSPEDYEDVSSVRWSAVAASGHVFRVMRCVTLRHLPRKAEYLSRTIAERMFGAEALRGIIVDHINGFPLDNRRCNLRSATPVESTRNQRKWHRKTGPNYSKYRGVLLEHNTNGSCGGRPYVARIRVNGKYHRLGVFATEKEAAQVYDEAGRNLAGPFFQPNFPTAEERGPVAPRVIQKQTPCESKTCHSRRRDSGKYVGVSSIQGKFKWRLSHCKRIHARGGFKTAKEAALARDAYIVEHKLPHTKNF